MKKSYDFWLKEYQLAFERGSSATALVNGNLKIYVTIFFAIISVCGFMMTNANILEEHRNIVVGGLLAGQISFGTINIFIHLSSWASREYYRERQKFAQKLLSGFHDNKDLKEITIEYLSIERYVKDNLKDDFIRKPGFHFWYLIFIILSNAIGIVWLLVFLNPYVWNLGFIISISLNILALEWGMIEFYVMLKKRGYRKKVKKRKSELIGLEFDRLLFEENAE